MQNELIEGYSPLINTLPSNMRPMSEADIERVCRSTKGGAKIGVRYCGDIPIARGFSAKAVKIVSVRGATGTDFNNYALVKARNADPDYANARAYYPSKSSGITHYADPGLKFFLVDTVNGKKCLRFFPNSNQIPRVRYFLSKDGVSPFVEVEREDLIPFMTPSKYKELLERDTTKGAGGLKIQLVDKDGNVEEYSLSIRNITWDDRGPKGDENLSFIFEFHNQGPLEVKDVEVPAPKTATDPLDTAIDSAKDLGDWVKIADGVNSSAEETDEIDYSELF